MTMRLTLDGLIRSLRLTSHGLAEDIEAGYGRDKVEPGALAVRQAHHEGYWNEAGSRRTRKPLATVDGNKGFGE